MQSTPAKAEERDRGSERTKVDVCAEERQILLLQAKADCTKKISESKSIAEGQMALLELTSATRRIEKLTSKTLLTMADGRHKKRLESTQSTALGGFLKALSVCSAWWAWRA